MADVKISQLPAATTPLAGTEEIPLVQSGTTKKATAAQIAAAAGAVTSVTASAPLASSGGTTPDISLTGTVPVANGGTGATDAATARSNLGAAASGANSDITSLTAITGGISTADFVQFDTGITPTTAVGKLQWDPTWGGPQIGMVGGNVNLQIGQETVVYVYNNTGSTILEGQVVRVLGSQGQRLTVALAQASNDANSVTILGMATENIANGTSGFVTTQGMVNNVNTSGFADGDVAWLSATVAGGITKTKPVAPNHLVLIGYVVKGGSSGAGSIYIHTQNGYELDELHDVNITSLTNGQLLQYDSAGPYWKNVSTINGSLVTGNISGNAANVTGIVAVANGGNGTATPALTAGTNVTITGTWPNYTIAASGGSGGGDVSGPASSTDNAVVRFDGTTGKLVQNSGMQVNDAGEVNVGVWKGTEVGISYGGTGASSASQARGNLLPSYTGNAGKVLAVNTGATDVEWVASGGGGGTVTSVALSMPTGFSVSGSPITTAGTLAVTTTLSGVLKGTGSGITAATSGTDYAPATSGSSILYGNGAGGFSNVTIGSGLSFSTGTLSATGGAGTVTSVDVSGGTTGLTTSGGPITSSGTITLAGTLGVANGGTGVTTLTGLVKGNGTSAFTAATAGTDYIVPGGALGTPSSGTLTNATGLPISTGVSGLGTGVATALAVNVGSAGAPVVNGGALGTPSSGTLTNATGLPISTGVSGLGTGIATFLTTPSSANLLAAMTDETGSGLAVFNSAPALTNPTVTNYVETAYSANSSTAITLALTNGTVQIITLTGNATITMPSAVAGKSFIMYLKQDATGSRTVTWSTVAWPGGTAPTITATASKMDIYSFFSDGTNWYGVTVGQNY